jgi:hypothetical protein
MDPNFDSKTAQQIADQSFEADALGRAQNTVAEADAAEVQRQASRDAARQAYDANVNAIGQAYANDMQNIDQEAADRLKKNADEIAKTRNEWMAAIDEANKPDEKGPQKKPPKLPKLGEAAMESGAVVGTFNSSGLSQLGAGTVVQRIAMASEQTAKNTKKIADQDNDGIDFD